MDISIIVTSYNYGNYIERCIRSCLDQNYPSDKFEVVVVDDNSTDQTLEIIEKFRANPNFRIIETPENVGVAEASNMGVREAWGRYVIRVDADDFINSDMIAYMAKYLGANKELFGVACDYLLVDNDENKKERVYAEAKPISCGIMYRKDKLIKCGLYHPDFRHREEEELRKRCGDEYVVDNLKIPFYRYRMHTNNKTKSKGYKDTKV